MLKSMKNSIRFTSLSLNTTSSRSLKSKQFTLSDNFKRSYPKVYQVFKTLKHGSSAFLKETFKYVKLNYQLSKYCTNQIEPDDLTWKDIEIYRQMPRDWKRVAPVIIISSFPFLNYIVLPIAYLYPQRLLCHQFWTIDQKLKFGESAYLKKIELYHPILNELLLHADRCLTDRDNKAKNELIDLINKWIHREQIKMDDVLDLNDIFNKKEFNLSNLSNDHINKLAALNTCQAIISVNNLKNLDNYAFWLAKQDKKLINVDLTKIELEYIYSIGYERGINSMTHSIEQLIKDINTWLLFSHKLTLLNNVKTNTNTTNNNTLLLHSKIFLRNIYSTYHHKNFK